jgi:hypothetical protein
MSFAKTSRGQLVMMSRHYKMSEHTVALFLSSTLTALRPKGPPCSDSRYFRFFFL